MQKRNIAAVRADVVDLELPDQREIENDDEVGTTCSTALGMVEKRLAFHGKSSFIFTTATLIKMEQQETGLTRDFCPGSTLSLEFETMLDQAFPSSCAKS